MTVSSTGIPWDRWIGLGATRKLSPRLVARILLGGNLGIGAFLVAISGSIMIWAMDVPHVVHDALVHPPDEAPVRVELVSSKRTSSSENEESVYAHEVRYTANGTTRVATLYTSGPWEVRGGVIDGTASLTDPRHVHVPGTRMHPVSPINGFFVLGFLVVPFLFSLGLWSRLRTVRLLRVGMPAQATCVRFEQIPQSEGDDVFRHFFAYTPQGTSTALELRHDTTAKAEWSVGDVEPVIYDPAKPTVAILPATIPGEPRIADDGTLTSRSPPWGAVALVLVVLAFNVAAAVALLR